jgi:hypothetical protein
MIEVLGTPTLLSKYLVGALFSYLTNQSLDKQVREVLLQGSQVTLKIYPLEELLGCPTIIIGIIKEEDLDLESLQGSS